MLAPYFGGQHQDMLLQPARVGEIALRADRCRQLAERLQRIAMRLAIEAAAHRDDMLLERPHLGEPAARPQHFGEVEHRGERLGVLVAEAPAQLVDALLLPGQGWLLAHRPALLRLHRDCFASLAMTMECHCEECSDEAISTPHAMPKGRR